ncbi:hypothetical protein H2203_005511 [Taxawa tesnikishii (nom. ined.)]|nr:hypothetical protein H2203_005511 [Dothideales sp. JES 119]
MSATFVPGGFDDYYMPPPAPELVAPTPERHMPEMSNQIQEGIANLELNNRASVSAYPPRRSSLPHLSPFPKLIHPPPNVPPSDEELESTLENARVPVLTSNDPEMQLAWAQDTLQYVGIAMDNEERLQATQAARPATPRIEHQLKIDAMNIVSFLADQRHPKAEFMRGMWLEFGRFGMRQDKKEAFRCYSRSADRGYARAEYRIGMLYEASNDPIKALKHYHQGVDMGDSASLYRLAWATARSPQGVDLIRKSAETADENAPQGAYVCGMLLARELPQIELPEGVLPYDERQARINIEKAAYLKFSKAQVRMGSAYELGTLGCEFNPALSLHYNALAAKQGEPEADMAISKWFLVGHEGLFPKNEELAYIHAQRAAQAGLSTAEFAMGYFNEIGMYVPQNLNQALSWYEKAAANGNKDAPGRIRGISQKQVLSRKDHENVALGRIKSTHGSRRGERPQRLSQQNPRLSSIADQGEFNGNTPPPRGTTPYPVDDRPPTVPPAADRPASVAPYPLADGPPRASTVSDFIHPDFRPPTTRPATTRPGPGYPDDRPSSAFHLDPSIRPTSVATTPGRPYGGGRPLATQTGTSAARRLRAGRNAKLPPQQWSSTPNALSTSTTTPQPPMPSQQPPQAPLQALDIGFSAPVGSLPPRRRETFDNKPLPPGQPGGMQPSPSTPNLNRPETTRPQKSQSDLRQSSRPSNRPPSVPTTNPTQPPASAAAGIQKPPTPGQAAATQKPAGKPSGKGPQTFAEMGIPATKQESECVIM